MMPNRDANNAWYATQFIAGRLQREIGEEIGHSGSLVCSRIKEFCDRWSGVDVKYERIYGEDRVKYALIALRNYFLDTGCNPEKPEKVDWSRPCREIATAHYHAARCEHAFLLRCEGVSLEEISHRVGIYDAVHAGQVIKYFAHKLSKAMRHIRLN